VSFYVHIPVNNLWERIWTLGDQNLGFWVKRVGTREKLCIADDWSLKRAPSVQSLQASGAWSLKRAIPVLQHLLFRVPGIRGPI